MLAIARERAAEVGVAVELREADAQALPFEPDSFDTVVCTLSLCTIPDHRQANAEMARVLRPRGRLLLLDHIGSRWWPVWAVQRLLELLTVPAAGEYQTAADPPGCSPPRACTSSSRSGSSWARWSGRTPASRSAAGSRPPPLSAGAWWGNTPDHPAAILRSPGWRPHLVEPVSVWRDRR